ncbi:MAG: FAD-dependent oxidoreductase [Bacteroidales bacterium]|nr:FAD-dependent oxidoreductase [Bacteroidales bacterium]
MITNVELILTPYQAFSEEQYRPLAAKKAGISPGDISFIRIIRKSIDARSRAIKVNLLLKIYIHETPKDSLLNSFRYQSVHNSREILVIGAGPAGLAAALRLIESGIRPVILERGKPVEERFADIQQLENNQPVDADSNYCFGEGGAGTYSDGKLYTRSKKRGDITRILDLFVFHGAPEAIRYEAHPHIGSDKLPQVIKNIRETILSCGGSVYYNQRVTDLEVKGKNIKSVITQDGKLYKTKAVILATGHSARDIYELFQRNRITTEPKLFAMGVRVEHPQELIDTIQYHGKRTEYLPAASYNVVEQVEKRGVYSFCMCPGGQIVPSATAPGEIVVNGMSVSQRNSPYANSGIVVQITENDLKPFARHGPLAGLALQQELEQLCYHHAMSGLKAPAQRLTDFVSLKTTATLPVSSYRPGTVASDLNHWLPQFICDPLREGFKRFDHKMKGFITGEAIIHGVESRTSSPVRIPRKENTHQHIQIENLFPCGEGSGYAGGIISSAIDGEVTAEKCVEWLTKMPR